MSVKTLLLSALACAAALPGMAFDWNGYASVYPSTANELTSFGQLASVSLNYGSNEVKVVENGPMPTLTNTDINDVKTATSAAVSAMENWDETYTYIVRVEFPAIVKNGNYTVTIPAGRFQAGTETNPEMTFNYTVNDPIGDQEELPELTLTAVTPAAGTALEAAGASDGFVYTLDTNLNDKIGWMWVSWYDVTDPDNPEFIASTDATHLDEAGTIPNTPLTITKVSMGSEKFYKGHTYQMEVDCYKSQGYPRVLIGTIKVQYTGTNDPYVYATQKLISVAPDPNTYVIESAEQAHFTLVFDGPVEIDATRSGIPMGIGAHSAFASITPNDAKTSYDIVIPEDALNNNKELQCFVFATDAEGHAVGYATAGLETYIKQAEENTSILVAYENGTLNKPLTVTPEGGEVTSLKSFVITNPDGVGLSPMWQGKYPYITKDREVVYTFNLEDDYYGDPGADTTYDYETVGYDEYITKITLNLPSEYTADGRYSLVIPSNTFNVIMDTMMGGTSFGNLEISVNYLIGNDDPSGDVTYDLTATVTPTPGTVVPELKEFTITFAEEVDRLEYDAFIYDQEDNLVAKVDIDADDDFFNMNDYHITLAAPITEPGFYTLVIPQGTLGDETFVMEMGQAGHGNAEIRAVYEVKTNSIEAILARGAADVYNAAGVLVLRAADADAIKALPAGIYIVGGVKVAVK